jgi:hypothetical protein
MSKVAIIVGVVGAALFLAETAAAATVYCGPRKAMVMRVAGSLHERPSSVALTNDGQLLEVLKSDTDVTWVILMTSPQGLSCIVAVGDHWQSKKMDHVVQDPQM